MTDTTNLLPGVMPFQSGLLNQFRPTGSGGVLASVDAVLRAANWMTTSRVSALQHFDLSRNIQAHHS